MDITTVDGEITHHVRSTNQLLGVRDDIRGGKTGYTDGALGTLILLIDINDGRDTLISIVLGTDQRFDETQKLISWGQEAHSWSK